VLSLEPALEINHLYQIAADQYMTVLLAAVQNNHLEATRFLLSKGAKDTVQYRQFCIQEGRRSWRIVGVASASSVAIKKNYTEIFKLFLAASANQNNRDRSKIMQGYLEEAVQANAVDITKLLLEEKGCDVNFLSGLSSAEGVCVDLVPPLAAPAATTTSQQGTGQVTNDDNTTADTTARVATATEQNNLSAATTMTPQQDTNKAKKNRDGLLKLTAVGPVLFRAAMNGNVEMASLLIDQGADVNKTTPGQRRTAMHVACYYGHEDMVKFLISKGADIQTKTFEGVSPVSVASWQGHKAVIQILRQELVKRKGKG